MSQHSSLKRASVSVKHLNVLKRYERIRVLQDNEKWGDRKSVYRLPKHKMIKLKMKKTKSGPEEGEGAAGAQPAEAGKLSGKLPGKPPEKTAAPQAPKGKPKT